MKEYNPSPSFALSAKYSQDKNNKLPPKMTQKQLIFCKKTYTFHIFILSTF